MTDTVPTEPTERRLSDRYRVGALLGRGGMASVYSAEDELLGRTVAIKIFADEPEPGMGDRKRSEMRVLASLSHPALVTVFDASIDAEPHPYLVMEYVAGPALHERLASGPLPADQVARMTRELAEALSVVHTAGIVHRDIKPSNVLLTSGVVSAKLADFGIATIVDATRLTTPGTLMGTVAYLAPEQLSDSTPAPAADIYSLGLVVLESVTGERAFPGTTAESMSARVMGDPRMPQSVPPALRSLIAAMTARDPAARPTASRVAELADAATRELAAGGLSDLLATMAVTEAGTPAEQRTEALDAPTRAFTAAHTAVLSEQQPTESQPTGRRPRTRLIASVLAGVLVLGLVVGAFALGTPAPAEPPQLPAMDAPLGEHFEQLLEAVTP